MIDKKAMLEAREELPVVGEERVYKRYLCIWNRQVEYPDGRIIDWDIAGHNIQIQPCFSVTFPFNTEKKTTTLVIEYAQGVNQLKYTFAAGGFDPKKHKDLLETAQAELSEEARLKGGEWIALLPEGHGGISELKWCRNRFIPYLVLNPQIDDTPSPRDAEEFMQVIYDVPLDEVRDIVMRGDMMLPSVQTWVMGEAYLREHGHI
ncbi:uncharacterized protein BJ171DRAFT_423593 [Polychytrium aggregatum]|uniref:uncharacterized protein n=1 Tax=Polychytrium aggregatum TaxID=110093 RepID=UPI0022FEF366|nr:uncharacterized protein BJ171DRAFT_423593 [Polychytrium aggregatum]KAI9205205.1 hypothetical protein BJ171DRAFT_423593 [Polychytrium aggregatum]